MPNTQTIKSNFWSQEMKDKVEKKIEQKRKELAEGKAITKETKTSSHQKLLDQSYFSKFKRLLEE